MELRLVTSISSTSAFSEGCNIYPSSGVSRTNKIKNIDKKIKPK